MKAVIEETTLPSFEIQDNILIVNVELYWENHAEFLRCCEHLLKNEAPEIVLDLSHVTFIFSAYMGTIGRLLAEAGKHGKRLRLRIPANLKWLFEIVCFDSILDIEILP